MSDTGERVLWLLVNKRPAGAQTQSFGLPSLTIEPSNNLLVNLRQRPVMRVPGFLQVLVRKVFKPKGQQQMGASLGRWPASPLDTAGNRKNAGSKEGNPPELGRNRSHTGTEHLLHQRLGGPG